MPISLIVRNQTRIDKRFHRLFFHISASIIDGNVLHMWVGRRIPIGVGTNHMIQKTLGFHSLSACPSVGFSELACIDPTFAPLSTRLLALHISKASQWSTRSTVFCVVDVLRRWCRLSKVLISIPVGGMNVVKAENSYDGRYLPMIRYDT
jgi:hypothetical protein